MDVALQGIGGILTLVGLVWLLVLAFSENIGWGIGSLLCGIVALIFAITRWPETKTPALLYIAGLVISGAGVALKSGG
jgi:hypothetical protein